MAHRTITAIVILITTMILALPAPARQRNVAPTFRSACADLKVSATSEGSSPAKPFTQDQVQAMVRDGLGDETGAQAIERRGVDFAPTEDFLQSVKTAGASQAFLAALRAAKHPQPTSDAAKKPLDQVQVIVLLAGQVPSHRVTMLVQERGIDFKPTDEYLQEVHLAGGEDELISALKSAKVTKPEHIDPALQARQAEVRQHAARAGEFLVAKRYADAEVEDRAALGLDPQNGDLHAHLGAVLVFKGSWDGATAESREALRLNPNSELAHYSLGTAHMMEDDWEGVIAEYREVMRLDPSDDGAHVFLGEALEHKGDLDGAISEYREALRLNPKNGDAHVCLGGALRSKGDWDGAIAEYREALRLNPNSDFALTELGKALGWKGDWNGAIEEYREALHLNPDNANAHVALGVALGERGDRDGEVAEERTPSA